MEDSPENFSFAAGASTLKESGELQEVVGKNFDPDRVSSANEEK
jgi:hypothetical protein